MIKGNSWKPVDNNLLDNTNIQALLSLNDTLFVGSNQGLFRSDKHTENWKELTNGLPKVITVLSLAAFKNRLFAGSAVGLFHS